MLIGFYSLCLIVTDSDSLLLALGHSEQLHSFCAGGMKAYLVGGGVLGNSTCWAFVHSCVYWGCLCASSASREGKGTIGKQAGAAHSPFPSTKIQHRGLKCPLLCRIH